MNEYAENEEIGKLTTKNCGRKVEVDHFALKGQLKALV